VNLAYEVLIYQLHGWALSEFQLVLENRSLKSEFVSKHLLLLMLSFQEKSLLLQCSSCATRVHPGCPIPPWTGMLTDDWSCYTCKEKVESYFKERDAYIAGLSKRYLLCGSLTIH
jgi:hypothetical protein